MLVNYIIKFYEKKITKHALTICSACCPKAYRGPHFWTWPDSWLFSLKAVDLTLTLSFSPTQLPSPPHFARPADHFLKSPHGLTQILASLTQPSSEKCCLWFRPGVTSLVKQSLASLVPCPRGTTGKHLTEAITPWVRMEPWDFPFQESRCH